MRHFIPKYISKIYLKQLSTQRLDIVQNVLIPSSSKYPRGQNVLIPSSPKLSWGEERRGGGGGGGGEEGGGISQCLHFVYKFLLLTLVVEVVKQLFLMCYGWYIPLGTGHNQPWESAAAVSNGVVNAILYLHLHHNLHHC